MKVNELRIGNYISISGEISCITLIENTGYFEYCYKNGMIDSSEIDYIQSIPLNEIWFLTFNFHEGVGTFYKNIEKWNEIKISLQGERWRVELIGMSQLIGTFLCFIDYVHQLQNLYFALTGEELTIKS